MNTSGNKRLHLFFIAIISLILYWNGLSGGLVWDDRTYFIENDILPKLSPWQLADIFLHPSNFWGEHLPLRDFLYVIEYNLFGLSPLGYHIVSLGLYILTGYVLYFFLLRLYSDMFSANEHVSQGLYDSGVAALIAAILFLVHPSHVETAAYISGQKDLLLMLFSFLAMLFFWKYFNSPGPKTGWLLPGIVTYYLAFLSKITAISLLLVIPVLWHISSREHSPRWKRSLIFWVAANLPSAVWVIISANIVGSNVGMAQLEGVDIQFRIIRAFRMLGFYAMHIIKPYPLSFGYPFDEAAGLDGFFWSGLVSVFALSALMFWKRRGILFFAAAIYLVSLAPALQLSGKLVYNASIYDRYLSIALLGVCILFERAFSYMYKKIGRRRFIAVTVLASAVLALSILTAFYVPTFRSDIDSTRNSYEKFPGWSEGSFNYVYSLIEGGRLDEAWDITIRENTFSSPLWVRSYFKGWIYLQRGEIENAVSTLSYSSYLAVNGGYYPFPSIPLGRALIAEGRYKEAGMELKKALSSEIFQPLETYHAKKELERIKTKSGE